MRNEEAECLIRAAVVILHFCSTFRIGRRFTNWIIEYAVAKPNTTTTPLRMQLRE